MPEVPDLVPWAAGLAQALVGRTVERARVGDPIMLRQMVAEPFPTTLLGRTLTSVARHGHFLRFGFSGDLALVINAMLAGRYILGRRELNAATGKGKGDTGRDPKAMGLVLEFDDGQTLTYVDEKRMGKIYVASPAEERTIPIYAALGVDVLDERAFTREAFEKLARGRRDQVRAFLMDKSALASIGNAYADEILFAARLHPKTMVRTLTPEDRGRLFEAIGNVLRGAIEEIEKRQTPPGVKVRDFLSVRGRDGNPCLVCGTTIRAVRVNDGDACFCPHCQPATRKLFVDFGKLPPAVATREAPAAADDAKSRRRPPRRSASPRRPPSGS
jgi:formamidopyrimidine-DNA glycosylase